MNDRLEKGIQENPVLKEACETKDIKDLMEGKTRNISLKAEIAMAKLWMEGRIKVGDCPRRPEEEYKRLCELDKKLTAVVDAKTFEDLIPNLPGYRQEEAPRLNWSKKMKQIEEKLGIKFHEDYKKVLFQFGEFTYYDEKCYFFCPENVEQVTSFCRKYYKDFPKDGYVFDMHGSDGLDRQSVFLQKSNGIIYYCGRFMGKSICTKRSDTLFYFVKSRCGIEV